MAGTDNNSGKAKKMSAERSKKDPQRNSALRKCFQAIVDRKQVNINMDILKLMLKNELQVNMDALDEQLSNVMPFMLIVYMRNWPGWQKSKEYYSGKLNFREWFLKFRQYIIVRLNYLIKNGYKEALETITAERLEEEKNRIANKSLTDRGTQTDHLAPKGIAPFALSIQCPPKMLTTLVFTNKDDDVVLSQHIDPSWVPISVKELLNWPHVGCEFSGVEFRFKRYNRHEYNRFINLTNCKMLNDKTSFIEEVKLINPAQQQKVFGLNLIWSYASQYMEVLRTLKDLDATFLDIVEAVIEEFLIDINDWDLNSTVASNTSVLFNIGHCSFVRNKKLTKGNKPLTGTLTEIGFCECFTPKVQTELIAFNDFQVTTAKEDIVFFNLDPMKRGLEEGTVPLTFPVPTLAFFCLFCDIKFDTYNGILEHLEKHHGMESNFLCPKCLRSLTISSLAKIRWQHVCPGRAT